MRLLPFLSRFWVCLVLLSVNPFLNSIFRQTKLAFAKSYKPQRPSFLAHQQRVQKGAKTSLHKYHLSRIGQCVEIDDKDEFLVKVLERRNRLQCSEQDLIETPQESFNAPMDSLTNDFNETLISPQQIATLKSAWYLAAFQNKHSVAQQLAQFLEKLPSPQRTQERLLLSKLKEQILSIEGPITPALFDQSELLEELSKLSHSALGEQVRAQALHLLSLWEPQESKRATNIKRLWLSYPQTIFAQTLPDEFFEEDWMTRGEAAFKARDYQKTIHALQHYSPLLENLHFVERSSSSRGLPNPKWKQKAALLISISLMRLREYPKESEQQLRIAVSGPDDEIRTQALFYQTHLFSRLGRWNESLSKLDAFLKTKPRGRQGREAHYLRFC